MRTEKYWNDGDSNTATGVTEVRTGTGTGVTEDSNWHDDQCRTGVTEVGGQELA